MDSGPSTTLQQLAHVAGTQQQQRTGHAPHAVTVILGDDMLVVTLHEALSQPRRPSREAFGECAMGRWADDGGQKAPLRAPP